jgi:hypothetical protein
LHRICCPWGEAPTAQTQKGDAHVAPKLRLYLSGNAASSISP